MLDPTPDATVRRLTEELRDERQRADHIAAQWESTMRELGGAIERCAREQQRADRLEAELDRVVSPVPERLPLAGPPLKPEPVAHQLDAARRHIAALEDRLARCEGRPVQAERLPDLRAIRNRLDGVAPGPWWACDPSAGTHVPPMWTVVNDAALNPRVGVPVEIVIEVGGEGEAEFVAHAPDDMRTLLAEVDRLTLVESRHQAVA